MFRDNLLLLFAGLCALLHPTAQAAGPARPNILLMFCDDLATQAVSAYGHQLMLLQTPHMDRLAREGMLFRRCLVPNSICGPSRAVIQTGKYSHLNGFIHNGSRFDSSQPTMPKMLQKAGYQTAVIGKWHLVSDPVGYDHWHILPGQGVYYNPPMVRNGQQVKHEGYTTDLIADFSIQYYHYYEFPAVHSVRRHYGVVTDRYKLFHFYEPDMNYWTLIDRERDPNELRNVYDDSAYAQTRRQLHTELARLRAELKVPATDPPASRGQSDAASGAKKGKGRAKAKQ